MPLARVLGFENWEKELARPHAREERSADEPWVAEVDENPGGGVSPRRLMEQGTPSTLESSLTSSVSASSGEIGASTMGDVCWRSAFTYCRRTSESLDPGRGDGGGDRGGAALEGCAVSTGSTGGSREVLLLAAREGVTTDESAPPEGAPAVALGWRCVGQIGHGWGSL